MDVPLVADRSDLFEEPDQSPSGEEGTRQGQTPPRWYRPWRLLALFCFVLFVVYFDQGTFASNGVTGCDPCPAGPPQPGIKTEFGLSSFQLGLLPSLFMVGIMVTSFLLCELRNHFNPFRLIGGGMAVWSLAALWTGLAHNYPALIFARMFVGAGEASIIMLAAPFVDDAAPPKWKALWFAVLTSFPSLGVAGGYLFGDVARSIGWRAVFYIEAAIGVPIVLFTLCAPPVNLRHGASHAQGGKVRLRETAQALWHDFKVLHQHPLFLANIWGYCAVQGCLGVYSFWGPKIFRELFSLDSNMADLVPGAIVVGTAIVGTLGGGYILDRVGSTLRSAMVLQAVSAVVALGALLLGFAIPLGLAVFILFITIGLLGLFLVTSPLYAVCMWSIPSPQRPTGQALLIITMHLFGDVPSPPLVGAIQGALNNWRVSMIIITCMLLSSVVLYACGAKFCATATDYRIAEGRDDKFPALAARAKQPSEGIEAPDAGAR